MEGIMKLFTKATIFVLLLAASFQAANAADAAKDQRDGTALLNGLYDVIDAGKLDMLAEIPSITAILAGRTFNSTTLRSVDSATLVPALINAFMYNNERTKEFKRGIRELQAMVVARATPVLAAPPCAGGRCPAAPR